MVNLDYVLLGTMEKMSLRLLFVSLQRSVLADEHQAFLAAEALHAQLRQDAANSTLR